MDLSPLGGPSTGNGDGGGDDSTDEVEDAADGLKTRGGSRVDDQRELLSLLRLHELKPQLLRLQLELDDLELIEHLLPVGGHDELVHTTPLIVHRGLAALTSTGRATA